MKEVIINTQEELDSLDINFEGYIYIEGKIKLFNKIYILRNENGAGYYCGPQAVFVGLGGLGYVCGVDDFS